MRRQIALVSVLLLTMLAVGLAIIAVGQMTLAQEGGGAQAGGRDGQCGYDDICPTYTPAPTATPSPCWY